MNAKVSKKKSSEDLKKITQIPLRFNKPLFIQKIWKKKWLRIFQTSYSNSKNITDTECPTTIN